jgi:hypothetical protein
LLHQDFAKSDFFGPRHTTSSINVGLVLHCMPEERKINLENDFTYRKTYRRRDSLSTQHIR